jgi:multidrug/hemolysin transport system permease protein
MENKFFSANDYYALFMLTRRNIKLFFKDKLTVLLSLLAPFTIAFIYILFLSDVQYDSIMQAIPASVAVNEKAVMSFVDGWMSASILGVSCLTVSLSANGIMVQDREYEITRDAYSSPVKCGVLTLSYFLYNFIVTAVILFTVFAFCLVYIALKGEWFFSAEDILAASGNIMLSVTSSTLITVFICGLLKSQTSLNAFCGIASAIFGFLIGAYIPMSFMPKGIRYFSCLLPGTHATGIFRVCLMSGALAKIRETAPVQVTETMSDQFSLHIDFFGLTAGTGVMLAFLIDSVVLFFFLNVILTVTRKKITPRDKKNQTLSSRGAFNRQKKKQEALL